MATVATDLITYLATVSGVGSITAALPTLYAGTMPEFPDECGAVIEYGGLPGTYVLGQDAIHHEFPRVQVVFRGEKQDYTGPRDKAESAYQALAALANTTINGTKYLRLEPLQPPFRIVQDGNLRHHIGFNLAVEKEPEA